MTDTPAMPFTYSARFLAPLLLVLTLPMSAGEDGPSGAAVRYGRDVRPILSDRCFECHGPDEAARQSGLRLDLREEAVSAGAITPGALDESELWARITSTDPNLRMPPPESGKPVLSEEEIAVMRRWIESDADYEAHWAFEVPGDPGLPDVRNEDWVRTDVDRFILAELEARGVEPAPPADPLVLFRRTFLELTGLPPTPEEVEAFESRVRRGRSVHLELDEWVERLLSEEPYSSRHAERMARPWLDQARYADTSGIHTDAGRQAWLWRDWVLEAYRTNKPFDEFLVEQLAGDLLPDSTIQQKVATGFNRNHVTTDEGGAINDEYLLEYAVDRVNTTGAVFLGMTFGCARCHDHKFDPVSMEDYYSLIAFFNNNEEPGLYSQQNGNPNRAFEPFIDVPTLEQEARLVGIEEEVLLARGELATWTPEEEDEWAAFEAGMGEAVSWAPSEVVSAQASSDATLEIQPDGSVLVSGHLPADDIYTITLRTEAEDLRLVSLEALPADLAGGAIGRASNGNAVLRSLKVEARSIADPDQARDVRFVWAWSDHAQTDQDFSVTNLITDESDPDHPRWWALGGHQVKGPRVALLLADEPFGYAGGTELVFTLDSTSRWPQHMLTRPRLGVASVEGDALAMLPVSSGRIHVAGPFAYGSDPKAAYETAYGAERVDRIEGAKKFTEEATGEEWSWRFDEKFVDEAVFTIPSKGRDTSILARPLFAPSAREIELSLGSDDGYALFLNGEKVSEERVSRAPAPDQGRATLSLEAGRNLLALKIVNTGGPAGAYMSLQGDELAFDASLLSLLLPGESRDLRLVDGARDAWRRSRSPRFAALEQSISDLEAEANSIRSSVPRAMVMRERAQRRPTYVMNRGEYDKPDMERPVDREVPAFLGTLPDDVSRDRLGLARWLVSGENPLTARVTVNRLWADVFGRGLVPTTDDFGLQGEWPSHPELLDWLALEFKRSGWDVQHILRLMIGSSTWRQSASHRVLADGDADRLLARYPRKRLAGEAVRDQALYVSGLLVEQLGGPSVKPYQPDGLWREVAMAQSGTRIFRRGEGDDLWRRSLYTYWKRAAPPPSMMAFDAPTREFCVVERAATDTPLQALVLWNDEQFVEAARNLAQRILAEADTDGSRIERLFLHVLGRRPSGDEAEAVALALADLRSSFLARPEDAAALLEPGESPVPEGYEAGELAAWTMVSSALLNLFEATNPR